MATEFDMKDHMEQWRGFTKLLTWSVVGIIVLLGLMAIFLL